MSRRAKRRLILLAVVVVLLGISAVIFKLVRTANYHRLVAESRVAGMEAYDRGDMETAVDRLNYYLKADPRDVEAAFAMAEARGQAPQTNGDHLRNSLQWYQHAYGLLEGNEQAENREALIDKALSNQLRLYSEMGMRVEAMRTADRILVRHPGNIEALETQAQIFYLSREFDSALDVVTSLGERDPSNLDYRRMHLQILRERGASERNLLEKCDEWIEQYHEDGRFHLLKASVLAEFGRMVEAQDEMHTVAELGADSLDVLQQAVAVADMIDLSDTATQMLESAKQRMPKEQWVREAAVKRAWLASDVEGARKAIEEAKQDFDQLSLRLRQFEALLFAAVHNDESTRRVLAEIRAAPAADEQREAIQLWADAVEVSLGVDPASEGAVEKIQRAIIASPQDAVLHFLLGEAYAQSGERAQSIESYRMAFDLEQSWLAAASALTNALLEAGRVEDAYIGSRLLLSRSPRTAVKPYLLFGRASIAVLRAGGEPAELDARHFRGLVPANLVAMLESMRQSLPENNDVTTMLAEAYVLTDRRVEAGDYMRRIIADGSADAETLIALSSISRRYNLGLENDLVAAAGDEGMTLSVAYTQAILLAEQGKAEEGLQVLDNAIAREPAQRRGSSPALRARAAYLARIDSPEALPAFRDLVDRFAGDQEVMTWILAQEYPWRDPQITKKAVDHLRTLLGPTAQQVRLAEASLLVRYEADNEAQLAKAIVTIAEVLEQSPDSLAALTLMARASLVGEHQSPERAIEHLERAIALYPGEPGMYYQLISLLQREGDFESAERYLTALSRLASQNPAAREGHLRLLMNQGDFQSAISVAGSVAQQTGEEADLLVLASMYQRSGKLAEAEAVYIRVMDSPQPSDLAYTQAAEFYAQTNRFQRGLDVLSGINSDNPARRAMLLGVYHQRYGIPADAERWFVTATENDPTAPQPWNLLSRYYLSRGEYKQAQQAAMKGLELAPGDPNLSISLAVSSLGDESSNVDIDSIIKNLGSGNDALLATLTLLNDVPREDGKAKPTPQNLAQAQQLIEDHGTFLPAWLLAITLNREARYLDDAVRYARRAVNRFPAHAEPAEWAASLLFGAGRWNEALAEAEEWKRRTLQNPWRADLMIATVLLEMQRNLDAMKQLSPYAEQIVGDRDKRPEHFMLWTRALVGAGRMEQASKMFAPLLKQDARWRQVWLQSTAMMSPDDAYDAASLITKDMIEGPQEALLLSYTWKTIGDRSNRADCYERAAQLAGGVVSGEMWKQAMLMLGVIEEARGDYAAAQTRYEQILQRDPEDPLAHNNIAYALARSGEQLDKALNHSEIALRKLPDDPNLIDTHGYVLLKMQRVQDALREFDRAAQLMPNDVGIALHKIEAAIALEQYTEASVQLRDVQRLVDRAAFVLPAQQKRIDELYERLPADSVSAGVSQADS